MTTTVSRSRWAVSFMAAAWLVTGPAFAQSKSSTLAKQVSDAMGGQQMQYIAAKDPSEADRFVAGLHVPGMGLLVISAKYSVPVLLNERIGQKGYADVYSDLQGAAVAGSKVFVNDLGGDGLVARPDNNQPYDTYDTGTKVTTFDGDWRKQNLTEDDYMKAFQTADERYLSMLTVLLKELQKKPS
jgi:hypothetical protein